MVKLKFLLIFNALFFSSIAFSQIQFVHYTIENNDTSIRLLTKGKTSRSVIFFCPTATIQKDVYFKKAEELNRSNKLKGLSDLTLYYIYYKQDTKNNSKGVKYVSSDYKDTMYIGQFECLFIGFDNKLLQRAKNKMKFNYDILKIFNDENIWNIPIVDTNKCFEKMQDRIPFYADFIRESCVPNYSTDEKIQFLRDSVVELSQGMANMKIQIDTLNAQLKRILSAQSMNMENSSQSNSSKKDNKKNKPGESFTNQVPEKEEE